MKDNFFLTFSSHLAIGDVCEPNPCENGGICKHGMDGNLFSCDCPHGFLGLRCECKSNSSLQYFGHLVIMIRKKLYVFETL